MLIPEQQQKIMKKKNKQKYKVKYNTTKKHHVFVLLQFWIIKKLNVDSI